MFGLIDAYKLLKLEKQLDHLYDERDNNGQKSGRASMSRVERNIEDHMYLDDRIQEVKEAIDDIQRKRG